MEAELKDAIERKASRLENEEEDDTSLSRRRRSMDFDRGGLRWGSTDKRKRWSVCGGEKRADLDLETIWEEALISAEANHVSLIQRQEKESEDEDEEEDEAHHLEDSSDDDHAVHDELDELDNDELDDDELDDDELEDDDLEDDDLVEEGEDVVAENA